MLEQERRTLPGLEESRRIPFQRCLEDALLHRMSFGAVLPHRKAPETALQRPAVLGVVQQHHTLPEVALLHRKKLEPLLVHRVCEVALPRCKTLDGELLHPRLAPRTTFDGFPLLRMTLVRVMLRRRAPGVALLQGMMAGKREQRVQELHTDVIRGTSHVLTLLRTEPRTVEHHRRRRRRTARDMTDCGVELLLHRREVGTSENCTREQRTPELRRFVDCRKADAAQVLHRIAEVGTTERHR